MPGDGFGAYILARDGRAFCAGLARILDQYAWQEGALTRQLRRRLIRHLGNCATCDNCYVCKRKQKRLVGPYTPVLVSILIAAEIRTQVERDIQQVSFGRARIVENTGEPAAPEKTVTETHGVELTDAAAVKIRALLRQEGRDDMHVYFGVKPGGTGGLKYSLYFETGTREGDLVREFHGVKVVVDRMSAPYLLGAVIDFVATSEKEGFTIDNPNAAGPVDDDNSIK